MAKKALVLSGGGAKGAFQFAAEKYAREVKSYRWDVIAGVSVGALNGVMLAMQKYQRLEEIWQTISNDKVYTGGLNVWSVAKVLLFGARSFYGNKPLWKMIDENVELDKIKIDLTIGAVSLQTGKYVAFKPRDTKNSGFSNELEFKKAVLASTVMPIIWPPVEMSPSLADMVDGGLRNISPLGDVLDANPDEVIIINCNPRDLDPPELGRPLKNLPDIGKRSLEIVLNEIFNNDIDEFIRINKNVEEARAKELTLHNEDGKPYKYFKYKIIEPDHHLDDTIDFSQGACGRSMDAGLKKATEVLG